MYHSLALGFPCLDRFKHIYLEDFKVPIPLLLALSLWGLFPHSCDLISDEAVCAPWSCPTLAPARACPRQTGFQVLLRWPRRPAPDSAEPCACSSPLGDDVLSSLPSAPPVSLARRPPVPRGHASGQAFPVPGSRAALLSQARDAPPEPVPVLSPRCSTRSRKRQGTQRPACHHSRLFKLKLLTS